MTRSTNAQRDAQQASPAELPRVDFRLLGPLEALVDGAPVRLGSPKQRALLTHLLLHANEAVPIERLIDELWPEGPPEKARHAIQVYVSRLRKALGGPRIEAHARAYRLSVEDADIDLAEFRRLVAKGRAGLEKDMESAAGQLHRALALWRGQALADLDGEAGVRDLVVALDEERLEALELRIEADLAAGRHADLIAELEVLITQHPAREQLYGQLMLALYRCGRQADALKTYQRARRTLLHELGLEPSPRLRELEASILRQDPSLTVEPPELRARRHLPAQPNAFIGRERELEDLVELVASGGVRLVTLTGTGGIGKTRLAIAAAERLAASFGDGVWFVELAPVTDPALIPSAIATALGVRQQGEQLEVALVDYLRDRELLLVLDNLEQLLEGTKIVSDLLHSASRLKAITTSREPLRLYGEHLYEVSPLRLPEDATETNTVDLERFDAVALFVSRARAVRRDFLLTAANAKTIAGICNRLDGLPLALELAAGRIYELPPEMLLERLSSRFEALGQGPRDAPERQQTLRAAIEWSYELLSKEAQSVFARFAVFAGGCTLPMAEQVCETDLGTLQSLVDKGLLRHNDGRFWMLETIREYAAERLDRAGETDLIRQRHAEAILALAEVVEQGLEMRSRDHAAWVSRVDQEHANLRAALVFLQDSGQTSAQLDLIGRTRRFWATRGYWTEGLHWAESALASGPSEPSRRRGLALLAAATLADTLGAVDQAREHAAEAVANFRAVGDVRLVASALQRLGAAYKSRGDYAEAEQVLQDAVAASEEANDPANVAVTKGVLADLAMRRGDYEHAVVVTEDALSIFRALGVPGNTAWALFNLAECLLRLGRVDEAVAPAEESLAISRAHGSVEKIGWLLDLVAALAHRRGDDERAARLIGAAAALRDRHGMPLSGVEAELYDETVSRLRDALGNRRHETAVERGRALGVDDAMALASQALGEGTTEVAHAGLGRRSAAGSA